TLRNPGSSGRKERPEAGTGSWLGRTRNQVINTLAVYRHRETDFCGGVRDHPGQHGKTPSPQKLDNLIIIIIGFLRPYTFTILFCTNYLCLSFLKTIFQSEMDMMDPRMYSREPGGPTDVDRKEIKLA
ncbi:hypothetical protein CK820_G0056695, partial [Pan troglodytes]